MLRREAQAGKIGSHPGFSRGRPCEFVGTPTRGGTARETAPRTSLYFWTGDRRRDGREGRRTRRIDASFSLNYRRGSYAIVRPAPALSLSLSPPHFFRPFPRPFRASSPFPSGGVKCIVCLHSYLQRRRPPSYFTERALQERVSDARSDRQFTAA